MSLQQKDEGEYMLIVENQAGRVETKTQLVVSKQVTTTTSKTTVEERHISRVDLQPHAPTFVEPLPQEVRLKKPSHTAKLECKLSSHPPAKVNWYFNETNVEMSGKYSLDVQPTGNGQGIASLTIQNPQKADSGRYMCEAFSELGRSVSTCVLVVEEEFAMPMEEQGHPEHIDAKVQSHVERIVVREKEFIHVQPAPQPEPPQFIRLVEPQIVKESNDVLLTCQILPMEGVDVIWTKDGKQIKPDQRNKLEYNPKTGEISLKITKSSKFDEGIYACQVSNKSGRGVSTANVVVQPKRKPKFVHIPQQKITVRSNQRVVAQAVIEGEPIPEVSWTFKNKPVVSDQRHVVTYQHNVTQMVIHSVTPQDVGEYKILARNDAGECSASVFIAIDDGKVQEPTVVAQHRQRDVEEEIEFLESTEEEEEQEQAPAPPPPGSKGKAPVFTKQNEPQLRRVNDGSKVLFECKVEGQPKPKVKWVHDKKTVKEAPDRRVYYDANSGLTSLELLEVFPQDTGEWSCVATNAFGHAISTAYLEVEPYEFEPAESPLTLKLRSGQATQHELEAAGEVGSWPADLPMVQFVQYEFGEVSVIFPCEYL